MEALELVTFHKDGRVQLNEDTLRKIFLSEAAKDRHVAVISVAGAFRRGKSFLLNFFIRYLRAKGASTWIGQQDEHLQGFKWNFGKNRVTTGICIWPEVFVIQNMAVVLLDTQGTFDQNTNMKENKAIVAISALLSSVQIFNYHQRLDSQDLMNLEFFLEYDKLVQEHVGKSKNIKIFQDIVFLIRDWNFANETPYGFEGGRVYFENFVNPPVDEQWATVNSDLVSVRQMLGNCFDKVECFLMPHPGDIVDGASQFKGQLKETSHSFWTSGVYLKGNWLWSGTGRLFSFTKWNSGEPDQTNSEAQACVYLYNGYLNDISCSNRDFYVICEEDNCS